DKDPRVRMLAVRVLAATVTAKDANASQVLLARAADPDPMVREEAVVALGVKGVKGAVPTLSKVVDEAMADKAGAKWAVGTCALVSLGKMQDPDAVEVLRRVYREAKDWRLKASAVVGLGRVQQVAAVEDLIAALEDKEPTIANTAYEFLRR